ncbi:MAG: hypothetical protein JWM34_4699 [Ilumatobacteraceae bacterium]|nr:hypothetical protein [Ilumatobacteraceae bacterium]
MAPTDPPTTEAATTTTALQFIDDGVYLVNTEFAPGLYRVGQYWERLAADGSIIDNDITSDCPSLVQVLPTDDQIKIQGQALPVSLTQPYDPIANNCTDGTFLVGLDIQPGRYKVTPDENGNAYWARINKKFDIIDNDVVQGQLIVTIKPGDFAIKIDGTLSPT